MLCKHEGSLRKADSKDPLVYPKERLLVLEHDNHTCRKCGRKFDPDMLKVDHKVRPQDGGSGQMQNLQILCIACHFQKHSELRESTKVLQGAMTVTLTIQLQPQIYEEIKSVAAEYGNATYSEIIGNLLYIRKSHYGRKEKDTMQVELWRGKEGLFSIFSSNDKRKKSVIHVQIFSRMEPRWARINRMTPQVFHAFIRTHNLAFVGRFDF
jgi:hypothetical protein